MFIDETGVIWIDRKPLSRPCFGFQYALDRSPGPGRPAAPVLGVAIGGFDMWTDTFGASISGTLRYGKPDNCALGWGGMHRNSRLILLVICVRQEY